MKMRDTDKPGTHNRYQLLTDKYRAKHRHRPQNGRVPESKVANRRSQSLSRGRCRSIDIGIPGSNNEMNTLCEGYASESDVGCKEFVRVEHSHKGGTGGRLQLRFRKIKEYQADFEVEACREYRFRGRNKLFDCESDSCHTDGKHKDCYTQNCSKSDKNEVVCAYNVTESDVDNGNQCQNSLHLKKYQGGDEDDNISGSESEFEVEEKKELCKRFKKVGSRQSMSVYQKSLTKYAKSNRGLKRMNESKTNERSEEDIVNVQSKTDTGIFKCDLCLKAFSSDKALDNHYMTHFNTVQGLNRFLYKGQTEKNSKAKGICTSILKHSEKVSSDIKKKVSFEIDVDEVFDNRPAERDLCEIIDMSTDDETLNDSDEESKHSGNAPKEEPKDANVKTRKTKVARPKSNCTAESSYEHKSLTSQIKSDRFLLKDGSENLYCSHNFELAKSCMNRVVKVALHPLKKKGDKSDAVLYSSGSELWSVAKNSYSNRKTQIKEQMAEKENEGPLKITLSKKLYTEKDGVEEVKEANGRGENVDYSLEKSIKGKKNKLKNSHGVKKHKTQRYVLTQAKNKLKMLLKKLSQGDEKGESQNCMLSNTQTEIKDNAADITDMDINKQISVRDETDAINDKKQVNELQNKNKTARMNVVGKNNTRKKRKKRTPASDYIKRRRRRVRQRPCSTDMDMKRLKMESCVDTDQKLTTACAVHLAGLEEHSGGYKTASFDLETKSDFKEKDHNSDIDRNQIPKVKLIVSSEDGCDRFLRGKTEKGMKEHKHSKLSSEDSDSEDQETNRNLMTVCCTDLHGRKIENSQNMVKVVNDRKFEVQDRLEKIHGYVLSKRDYFARLEAEKEVNKHDQSCGNADTITDEKPSSVLLPEKLNERSQTDQMDVCQGSLCCVKDSYLCGAENRFDKNTACCDDIELPSDFDTVLNSAGNPSLIIDEGVFNNNFENFSLKNFSLKDLYEDAISGMDTFKDDNFEQFGVFKVQKPVATKTSETSCNVLSYNSDSMTNCSLDDVTEASFDTSESQMQLPVGPDGISACLTIGQEGNSEQNDTEKSFIHPEESTNFNTGICLGQNYNSEISTSPTSAGNVHIPPREKTSVIQDLDSGKQFLHVETEGERDNKIPSEKGESQTGHCTRLEMSKDGGSHEESRKSQCFQRNEQKDGQCYREIEIQGQHNITEGGEIDVEAKNCELESTECNFTDTDFQASVMSEEIEKPKVKKDRNATMKTKKRKLDHVFETHKQRKNEKTGDVNNNFAEVNDLSKAGGENSDLDHSAESSSKIQNTKGKFSTKCLRQKKNQGEKSEDGISFNRFYRCEKCKQLFHAVSAVEVDSCKTCAGVVSGKKYSSRAKGNLKDKEKNDKIGHGKEVDTGDTGTVVEMVSAKNANKDLYGNSEPDHEYQGLKLILQKVKSPTLISDDSSKLTNSPEIPRWKVRDTYDGDTHIKPCLNNSIVKDRNGASVETRPCGAVDTQRKQSIECVKTMSSNNPKGDKNSECSKLLKDREMLINSSESSETGNCMGEAKGKLDNLESQGKTGKQVSTGGGKIDSGRTKSDCEEKLNDFEKALLKVNEITKRDKSKKKDVIGHKMKTESSQRAEEKIYIEDNKSLLFKKRQNQTLPRSEVIQPFQKSKIAQRIYIQKQKEILESNDGLPDFCNRKIDLGNLQPLSTSSGWLSKSSKDDSHSRISNEASFSSVNKVSGTDDIETSSTGNDKSNSTAPGSPKTLPAVNGFHPVKSDFLNKVAEKSEIEKIRSGSERNIKDLKSELENIGILDNLKPRDIGRSACELTVSQPWNQDKSNMFMRNSQSVLPSFSDTFSKKRVLPSGGNDKFSRFTSGNTISDFDSDDISGSFSDEEDDIDMQRSDEKKSVLVEKSHVSVFDRLGKRKISGGVENAYLQDSAEGRTVPQLSPEASTKFMTSILNRNDTNFCSSTPAVKSVSGNYISAAQKHSELNVSHISASSPTPQKTNSVSRRKQRVIKRLEVQDSQSGYKVHQAVYDLQDSQKSTMLILSADCSKMDLTGLSGLSGYSDIEQNQSKSLAVTDKGDACDRSLMGTTDMSERSDKSTKVELHGFLTSDREPDNQDDTLLDYEDFNSFRDLIHSKSCNNTATENSDMDISVFNQSGRTKENEEFPVVKEESETKCFVGQTKPIPRVGKNGEVKNVQVHSEMRKDTKQDNEVNDCSKRKHDCQSEESDKKEREKEIDSNSEGENRCTNSNGDPDDGGESLDGCLSDEDNAFMDDVLEIYASDEEATFLLDSPNCDPTPESENNTETKMEENQTEIKMVDNHKVEDMELETDSTPLHCPVIMTDFPATVQTAAVHTPYLQQKLPFSRPLRSNPLKGRWMPRGWCYRYFTRNTCNSQCMFRHDNPTEEVLKKCLPDFIEKCRIGEIDSAMNMLVSQPYFLENIGQDDLDCLYGFSINSLKMEYCHRLLQLIASRDLIKQGHIEDIIFLWKRLGYSTDIEALKDAFYIAKQKNIIPHQTAVYILLEAFSVYGDIYILWDLITSCTQSEDLIINQQFINRALSVVSCCQDKSLLSAAVTWLMGASQKQLVHVNSEVLQSLRRTLQQMNLVELLPLVDLCLRKKQSAIGERQQNFPEVCCQQLSKTSDCRTGVSESPNFGQVRIPPLLSTQVLSRAATPTNLDCRDFGQLNMQSRTLYEMCTQVLSQAAIPTVNVSEVRRRRQGNFPQCKITQSCSDEKCDLPMLCTESGKQTSTQLCTTTLNSRAVPKSDFNTVFTELQNVLNKSRPGHVQTGAVTLNHEGAQIMGSSNELSARNRNLIEVCKAASESRNWQNLADIFIACSQNGPPSPEVFEQVLFALTKDDSCVGKAFEEFIIHIKQKKIQNPVLRLDKCSLSVLASEIFYACHKRGSPDAKDILLVILDTDFLSLNPSVGQRWNICLELVATEFLSGMGMPGRAAEILLEMPSEQRFEHDVKSRLLSVLQPLTEQLCIQGKHKVAFQIFCMAYKWKHRGLSKMASELIQSCLLAECLEISVEVYKLYLTDGRPFDILDTLKRSMLNALMVTNMQYSKRLYREMLQTISTHTYLQQSLQKPRCVWLQSFHTYSEIKLIIEEYLMDLYKVLCEEKKKNVLLTNQELYLDVAVDAQASPADKIKMPYIGPSKASLSNVKEILSTEFGLESELSRKGIVKLSIQADSLEKYLKTLDQQDGKFGLEFG